MPRTTFKSLVQRLSRSRRGKTDRRRPPRSWLTVEGLEDRLVPATTVDLGRSASSARS